MITSKAFFGAIVASLGFTACVSTSAQAFTFVEIANTATSDFTTLGDTAINDLGQVAFAANVGGQSGIFSGDGGVIAPVVDLGEGLTGLSLVDINSAGTVVFAQAGAPGIFTSSGGIITPLVTEASSLGQLGFTADLFFAPQINELGAITFTANNFATNNQGLYLAKDGVITAIAEAPDFDIFRFSINNNDQIAFFSISGLAPDGDAVFISDSGGAPVALPDPLGFGTIEGPTLNDNGAVAFDTLVFDDAGDALQSIIIQ
ncbi:MAG: choice-of-anchor tandem repeat NxxGxxAF-containing protein, partial [Phormidesmis sp.]